MPFYFFNTPGRESPRDEEGLDLPDKAAARAQAIKFAGQCLTDDPGLLDDRTEFIVEVRNERALLLFTVLAWVTDAPAARALSTQ